MNALFIVHILSPINYFNYLKHTTFFLLPAYKAELAALLADLVIENAAVDATNKAEQSENNMTLNIIVFEIVLYMT